jgi:hypothetical protein
MRNSYSTCIIPETSEGLLFSLQSNGFLYHCWKNKQQYVVIKESNDFSKAIPNQLLNFTELELKRYLYLATEKLKYLDAFLFFNENLWSRCFEK